MAIQPPTPPCERDGLACIDRFAIGRLSTDNFCATCTRQLMAALEWVTGRPLVWNPAIVFRAFTPDGGTP